MTHRENILRIIVGLSGKRGEYPTKGDVQHKQNTRLASAKNLGRVTPIIPGAGTPPKSCPLIGRAWY